MRFPKTHLFVVAVTLCATAVVSQAKNPMHDTMREMLVSDALSSGENYYIAKLCGALPDALKAYETRKQSEANVERAAYKELKVDYYKTFHSAEPAAAKAYAVFGADANNGDKCRVAIKQLTCTGLRC